MKDEARTIAEGVDGKVWSERRVCILEVRKRTSVATLPGDSIRALRTGIQVSKDARKDDVKLTVVGRDERVDVRCRVK